MKKVIVNSGIVIVPSNSIQCSVCGGYFDPSVFKNEDEDHQSRMNCVTCYNLSREEMSFIKTETEMFQTSTEYYKLKSKLKDTLHRESFLSREEMVNYIMSFSDDAKFERIDFDVAFSHNDVNYYKIDHEELMIFN